MASSQASSSASSSAAASPHPTHRPHDSSPHPPSSSPPPPHQHHHHPSGATHDRHPDPRASSGTDPVEVITSSPVARMMLPPLGADADTLLAVGRHLDQNVPDALVPRPKKHEMPEKCLTFCTQRADAPALCRMLCLRKRPMAEKREEVLRRLRPPNLRQRQQQELDASHEHEQRAESSRAGSAEASGSGWSFNPFEALKRRIEPYSIIYVRGLLDGVVGRYMEELEYDDGVRDFGEISRGMDASNRRRRVDPGPVWMKWGDEGTLVHIPLIYYLRPWLSFSETVEKTTAPARNLLKMYTTSFTDGSQLRNLQLFHTELTSGAPFAVVGKMRDYWTKKIAERKEEMEKLRKEVMAMREAEVKARLAKREEQRAAAAAATATASQDEAAVRKVMDRLNQSKRARDQDGGKHAPASAGSNDEEGIRR